ncbi:hypothetical protein [Humibacter ginsenosidimutans]|nr:hypothetical protein [Humibacter ginsenosidimutans]
MSTGLECTCTHCGQVIGIQYRHGDGLALFTAHIAEAHPELLPADGEEDS